MPKSSSLQGTIVKVFEINCPVERAYRAFTTKQDLQEWLMDRYEIDARKGGKYTMGSKADGVVNSGEFLQIVPNELLVYTWNMQRFDEKGKLIRKTHQDQTTKVTVRFEKTSKGTKIRLTHEGFPEQDEDFWAVSGGWDMCAGEVLRYYLEHSQAEFDKWWNEGKSSLRERMAELHEKEGVKQ
jgi:uncharacterized protein YndB with AHSA1/START domain